MKRNDVKDGMRVKTNDSLVRPTGMILADAYLNARQPSREGRVTGEVPRYGGDVWWVIHDDGNKAPYMCTELEPVQDWQKSSFRA